MRKKLARQFRQWLMAAVAILLLPLYGAPLWIASGWDGIAVPGHFVFTDLGMWVVRADEDSGAEWLMRMYPLGLVTVVPDQYPDLKLLAHYVYASGECGPASFAETPVLCAQLFHPHEALRVPMEARLILSPNPYVQAWDMLGLIAGLKP
jgi:hypothetical protein